jgi:hypothetical protein
MSARLHRFDLQARPPPVSFGHSARLYVRHRQISRGRGGAIDRREPRSTDGLFPGLHRDAPTRRERSRTSASLWSRGTGISSADGFTQRAYRLHERRARLDLRPGSLAAAAAGDTGDERRLRQSRPGEHVLLRTASMPARSWSQCDLSGIRTTRWFSTTTAPA